MFISINNCVCHSCSARIQTVKVSHSYAAPLLSVERVPSASHSSSSSSSSETVIHNHHNSSSLHSNSHHRATSSGTPTRNTTTWRQRYSLADEGYTDYQTSLFARPLRRLTWKETGHLLLINTAMFWPDYLYPRKDARKITPERRRRLLFSYAPGECCSRWIHACMTVSDSGYLPLVDWIITIGVRA